MAKTHSFSNGMSQMKTFYKLLIYGLIAATTNNYVWFALTFFAWLETKSVISTAFVGAVFLVATATLGIWLGSLVDRHKKKHVLLGSSTVTLAFFIVSYLFYTFTPESAFTSIANPAFWIFAFLLMCGVVAGNVLNIAIPTLITHLVPEDRHDKANGLFGTVMGISFAITSFASGVSLAYGGMNFVLLAAITLTFLAVLFLAFVRIPEKKIIHTGGAEQKKVDLKGTIRLVRSIPGLFPLIFFTTFNNLIGGIFMALMDAYGLTLVSVEVWGFLWGVLSFGFIIGGLIIAKKGLGENPLRTLFLVNIIIWTMCIFFPIQPSIILLAIGGLFWMTLYPFIEATEQTIIQKVVPAERQGRVFGFAQSIEQSASPLTAFFIGPITQLFFIPFMTTGQGVELIGDWFGVGTGRGIALVFILSGIIGLTVTLIAMRSNSYKLLAQRYAK